MIKHNTDTAERQGNGQFSQKKRVATNAQLDHATRLREQIRNDEANKAWLAAHGFGYVDADEIFAAV